MQYLARLFERLVQRDLGLRVIPGEAEAEPIIAHYLARHGGNAAPALAEAVLRDKRYWVRKVAVDWLHQVLSRHFGGWVTSVEEADKQRADLQLPAYPVFVKTPGAVEPHVRQALAVLTRAVEDKSEFVQDAALFSIHMLGPRIPGAAAVVARRLRALLDGEQKYEEYHKIMGASHALEAIGPTASPYIEVLRSVFSECLAASKEPGLYPDPDSSGWSDAAFRRRGVEKYARYYMAGDFRKLMEAAFPDEEWGPPRKPSSWP